MNYNCDEYPLASSFQGSNFVGGPPNSSAHAVLATSNSSQGGLTRTFYRSKRILNKNPFWVNVVLTNGTSSW